MNPYVHLIFMAILLNKFLINLIKLIKNLDLDLDVFAKYQVTQFLTSILN